MSYNMFQLALAYFLLYALKSALILIFCDTLFAYGRLSGYMLNSVFLGVSVATRCFLFVCI